MTRHTAPTPGFLPGLMVGDPMAAHWMAQAMLRLRREVAWLFHLRGGQADQPQRIDALSDSLDLTRHAKARLAFMRQDETAIWLGREIARPAPDIIRLPQGGFGWLARHLRLTDLDCLALALALIHAADSASCAVMAAVQNNAGADGPTLALLQRLIDQPEQVLALLDPGHPLVVHHILALAGDWSTPFAISPIIARQLMFPEGPAPRALSPILADDATLTTAESLTVARLRARPAAQMAVVPIAGPPQSPRAQVAARMAKAVGLTLAEVAIPLTPGTLPALAPLAVTAWLRQTALYLPVGTLATKDALATVTDLAALPLVVVVGVEEDEGVSHLPTSLALPRLRLAPLGPDQRAFIWRDALPHIAKSDGGAALLTGISRRFRFEAAGITRVAQALSALGRTPDEDDIIAACRADLDLGDLAQPVTPRFGLDELMLPPTPARQIAEIVRAMGVLSAVHHDWGTGRAWNESGLSVLFAGPPGTGKTMAAEAIARDLKMPMYRIDLSQVVNKYIGETEKNLRRLFDAADAADVILFFDEADALFGKRTEVKDAHDRYANLEVSYLLERMERFRGMAILASNRKKDLDEAFMRRLRHVVQFPLPGPDERLRIWQAVLPAGVERGALDLPFLADRIALSGGHIRSAVFNACLASAHLGAAPELQMPAVVRALRDEFEKLGRAVSLDQFGPYACHLEGRI